MSSIAAPVRHRFDVDAYHRLGEAGVLAPGAKVVVDMARERLDVLRSPQGGRYAERATLARGDAVSPGALPGVSIAVSDVFD